MNTASFHRTPVCIILLSVIDEVVMVLAELGNNITTLNQFKDFKRDDLTLPEPWMGIELHMCACCSYLFMF